VGRKSKDQKAAEASSRHGAVPTGDEGAAVFVPGASAVPPRHFDPEEIAQQMRIYWKSGDGDNFYLEGDDGRWSRWTKDATIDAMRALPDRLIAIKARENEALSESKQVLLFVRRNRAIEEVLPSLPGYGSGVHELDSGERVLVKQAPRLIEPTPGEWPNIKLLIEGRLDRRPAGGVDQTPWFHCWCKIAAEAIRSGKPGHWRAGHAVILAGPGGCGKNRLQEQLITPLLGGYGRFADPQKFLFEGDEFNGDVFQAEHLMLSEIPTPSQRTVDRTSLAEKIKQVVANPAQRMRLMRTEPCSVSPFWRLTISVNDDPDKLRSLPLITPDFGDKVLIFHCMAAPLPLIQEDTEESWRIFRDTMAEELPHYLHWLMNEWQIPEDLRTYPDGRIATRFGFREYHAPFIKEELFDDTPAAQLMSLIDSAEFDKNPWDEEQGGPQKQLTWKLWEMIGDRELMSGDQRLKVWWGKAESLQMLLTGEGGCHCNVATMAKKLFTHSKCSTLLRRLFEDEQFRDTRITRKNTNHWKGWVIAPPSV
jgi:hypothetical protein